MEMFIEQMVQKKKSKLDILLALGLSLGSTLIALVLFNLSLQISGLGGVLFLLIAGVFYLAYNFVMSRNLEYEYAMVNNEIDVDKIANQRKRKKMTTLNVKKMEDFGKKDKSPNYKNLIADMSIKKVYACRDKNADDVYFAVYYEDGIKKMLLFNPKQEIVDLIVKFNPREQYAI